MQAPQFRPTSVMGGFGLGYHDGVLIGGGPDYEVRFDAAGVEFTPALPPAPRTFPMTMRVASYGRGKGELTPSTGPISVTGNTAFYNRAEFVETYEVRQGGIKQNFTFRRVPVGGGDLVVRLQVATDLQLSPQRGVQGELQFLYENIGGITIGEVIGIDANGVRVTGSSHYDNGTLELRLPESFVDSAALPLVLDPFIGTLFQVAAGYDDSDPDVAYDATNDNYLVTWARTFSANSRGLRAQRVGSDGALIGSFVTIETSALNGAGPRVANIATEDAFLVVYSANNNILGRAVRASNGAISSQAIIRDTADVLSRPDVGGEAVADNDGIVVWDNNTSDEIQAKQVSVNGGVSPPTVTPFAAVALIGDTSATWTNSAPAISKSGGTTGYHCIVWSRQFASSVNTTVRAALVTRNLLFLDVSIEVAGVGAGDSDVPGVDGDGRNWVVAWENEATPGSGDNNVQARSIGFNPNAAAPNQGVLQSGIITVEGNLNDDERGAQVVWMGESAMVMYEDASGVAGDFDIFGQPVDLLTCLDCEPRLFIAQTGGDQGPVRAASKASGGTSSDQTLIVWNERDLATNDNDIWAIRYEAQDGISTNLGGGCGTEGNIRADCAITGNNNFAARLRGSLPFSAAWLVIGSSRIDLPCGTCTLVPDPFAGFIVAWTTNSVGDAAIPIAIPSSSALVGATFIHQWLVADATSPACTTFGSDLSDALATEIQ